MIGPGRGRPLEPAVRLFVALSPPPEWRQGLEKVMERLRAAAPGHALRWVRPDAIHVTLKFLGEVDPVARPGIEAGVARAAACARPLRLEAGGAGGFGGPRRLRVIWIGLDGDLPPLAALAGEVDDRLAACGLPRETRPFHPHLTLARVRERASAGERARIHAALEDCPPPALAPWPVTTVELIRSRLEPEGARYETLGRWPLATA